MLLSPQHGVTLEMTSSLEDSFVCSGEYAVVVGGRSAEVVLQLWRLDFGVTDISDFLLY